MNRNFVRTIALLGLPLLLASCGDEAIEPEQDSGEIAAGEAVTAEPATNATEETVPATQAAETSGPDISAYLGKYLGEEVDGVTWEDHPVVAAGIARSVSDATVRTSVLETSGPSAPIEMIEGKVSSWACEQHNCGDHQWMVMVDPASGATDVCYHDASVLPGQSRWFLADGQTEERPGNCQVE